MAEVSRDANEGIQKYYVTKIEELQVSDAGRGGGLAGLHVLEIYGY